MTPSRVTNSRTITFLMTEFLQHLATSQEAVIRRWAFRRAQRHASFVFCGSSPKTGTRKKSAENRIVAQEGSQPVIPLQNTRLEGREDGEEPRDVRSGVVEMRRDADGVTAHADIDIGRGQAFGQVRRE